MYHLRDIKNKNKFAHLRNAEGGGVCIWINFDIFCKISEIFCFCNLLMWWFFYLCFFVPFKRSVFWLLIPHFLDFMNIKKICQKWFIEGGGYIFRSILIFFAKFREFFVSVTFWCNDFFYLELFLSLQKKRFSALKSSFFGFHEYKKDLSKVIHWRTLRSLRMTIFNS